MTWLKFYAGLCALSLFLGFIAEICQLTSIEGFALGGFGGWLYASSILRRWNP
jgi:hypothetical protein